MFKSILPFLLILSFRFLGLFIILPVISLLVSTMPGANALTIGVAIGAPYLVQMIFQPFFGRASDKYARKNVVILGLIIFLIGSIVCMLSDSIYALIVGRCLQGAGAIGGVLSALVADCVKEENRTRAAAIMGGGIFASFVLAMILGSILGFYYGLHSLFLLTSILSVISILMVIFLVKKIDKIHYVYPQKTKNENRFKGAIVLLHISSFLEKCFMILTFSITPIILKQYIDGSDFYKVYVPAIIIGILALGPTSIIGEKRGRSKEIILASIIVFLLGYLFMNYGINHLLIFAIGLALFFCAFSAQEAILQGMISKIALAKNRGAVIGDFTAYGFGGSFIGALVGGYYSHIETMLKHHNILFYALAIICIIWVIIASMYLINPERSAKTLYLPIESVNIENIDKIQGIIEWYENKNEHVYVIKYDMKLAQMDEIIKILESK